MKKIILAASVLAMVLFSLSALPADVEASSFGEWTTKAPLPNPRFGLGAASVNGIIYAIGGDVDYYGCGPTAANEAYDPATNTWTAKAPLPTARMTNFGVAVLNGIIYVIGGNPACVPAIRTVEAYDPVANTWTTKAPLPTGVGAAAVGVVNGILYVAGGGDNINPATATLYAYNPGTNTWSTKASMPETNYTGAGVVVNGIFYVVGGIGPSGSYATSTFAYDPTTDTWSTKASMNVPRGWFSATVVNDKIYTIGGGSSATSWDTTTEVYDPATDTWTVLDPMPTGRQGFGVAQVNGTIYAIGGITASLGAGISTVEAYTPAAPPSDVLVAGGISDNNTAPPTAEVFHEATGTWSSTLNNIAYGTIPTNGICGANMTLLGNGKALIAGGSCGNDNGTVTNLTSLYDPATNLWSAGGSMAYGRTTFGLVTLANGDALAIGGCAGGCSGPNVLGQYAYAVGGSSEMYSATNNSWATKHTLNTARSGLGKQNGKAVTLQDGKVLVCGGNNAFSTTYTSCEIYDPAADTWTTTTGSYPEVGGPTGVILLNSGKVLAVLNTSLGATLFDPTAKTWSATGAPLSLQNSANLTLLSDGRVLMTGGMSYSAGTATALATTQIYDPTTGTWTATGSMSIGRIFHFAVPLADGKVLAGGGMTGSSTPSWGPPVASAEIFDPATGLWSPTGSMAQPRWDTVNAVRLLSSTAATDTTLTITKSGTGTGNVTADSGTIDWTGNTGTATYTSGTNVTLTATPDAGSAFEGWSGDGCAGTGTCVVTMDAARNVTATFVHDTIEILADNAGSFNQWINTGVVLNPGDILTITATGQATTAGSRPLHGPNGASPTLTPNSTESLVNTVNLGALVGMIDTPAGAIPSSPPFNTAGMYLLDDGVGGTLLGPGFVGSSFSQTIPQGASGILYLGFNDGFDADNQGSYIVTINVTPASQTWTVTPSAGLGGNISPNMSQTVNDNSTTAFTVSPDTGYHIAAVTGCGGVFSGNTYTTGLITSDCTVAATFAINTYLLTVSKAGTGSGTVTSSPSGISCDSDCSETYDYNMSVTLTALPSAGTTFTGWSGACTGAGSCTVTIDAARNVTATFSLNPVNGECGSSNGQTNIIAPNSNLCNAGTPSTVTGSGPWSWTCNGLYGGTDSSCSANIQTYNLTITKSGNGSISCSPAVVIYNTSSTCTITPNAGYQVENVSIGPTGGSSSSLGANTLYTINSITANMTVSATFALLPTARFTWKTDATTDYNVLYDASASTCPYGATCTYSWSTGETGITASHPFTNTATTTVTLTVTASPGGSSTYSASVTPKYVASTPTVVSITNNSVSGNTATVNYSLSGGTAPYTVKAVWGDGTSGTTPGVSGGANSLTHSYANAGTYTVVITAQDSGVSGGYVTSNSKSTSVTIAPSTLTVSGTVTRLGGITPVSSASVMLKLNGVAKKLVYTNAGGNYTMTGVAPGTYTVTIAKSGLTFANPAATVTVTTSNVTGVNISSTN